MSLINKHSLGLQSSPLDASQFGIANAAGDPGIVTGFLRPEPVVHEAAFSTIYAFGDSLSDAGNDYAASGGLLPSSPPYSDGVFRTARSGCRIWRRNSACRMFAPASMAGMILLMAERKPAAKRCTAPRRSTCRRSLSNSWRRIRIPQQTALHAEHRRE